MQAQRAPLGLQLAAAMRGRRAAAALLLLVAAAGAAAAAKHQPIVVSTGYELLDALFNPSIATIALASPHIT